MVLIENLFVAFFVVAAVIQGHLEHYKRQKRFTFQRYSVSNSRIIK